MGKRQLALCLLVLATLGENIQSEEKELEKENVSNSEGRRLVEETLRFSNRELDIVFVIDRSMSIPLRGWQDILDFIHSFLENFTISSQNTRVAVITFSTNASIDINDLKAGTENKCSVVRKLQKRLRIKVPFGYTATNEALEKTVKLMYNSRFTSKKVVIVLTDGRSNLGPPPIRASLEMRSLKWDPDWNREEDGPQLEIFAFGVHDADMIELQSIASPLPNHTYHIQHFSQFEKMARNLHKNKQKETWELVEASFCKMSCSEHAVCMCATRSGQDLCVCKEGFEGNGQECKACELGFYKDSTVPYACNPCPDNMTTLQTGATDRLNCVCKLGYYKDGSNCSYRLCPTLPSIKHGFAFHVAGSVHDEVSPSNQTCLNTPGTSCHYRCQTGYRLSGHPGLICQPDGNWKGSIPECKIVDCRRLEYHDEGLEHGTVTYSNRSTTYMSIVMTSCDRGWRMFGDKVRRCTQFGVWSGTKATCVEARCPALRIHTGMEVLPMNCSSVASFPGTVCRYSCLQGYRLQGRSDRTCGQKGSWLEQEEIICKDIQAPTINCPEDITVLITQANYALVYWENQKAEVHDNSRETTIKVSGVQENPAHMTIGYHFLQYTVVDRAGNTASCTRTIQIVGRSVSIQSCPSNITDLSVLGTKKTVYWSEPVFVDSNGKKVGYKCSRNNGSVFWIGSYNVVCTVNAEERLHNPPSCSFSILLKRKRCDVPPAPLHGSLTCTSGTESLMVCSIKCNNGYDFYHVPQTHYKCDLNGDWILRTPDTFWPDCSRRYNPRRAKMKGLAEFFYYSGRCENVKDQIKQKFKALVQKFSWDVCGENSCDVRNVSVSCGQHSRRKRKAKKGGENDEEFHTDLNKLQNFDPFKDISNEEESKVLEGDMLTMSGEDDIADALDDLTESVTSTNLIKKVSELPPSTDSSESGVKSDKQQEGESTDSTISEDATVEQYHGKGSHTEPEKLFIGFELEIEKNGTEKEDMTQADLEHLIDTLWDIADGFMVDNITVDQVEVQQVTFYSKKIEYGDPVEGDCKEGYLVSRYLWPKYCIGCPRGTKSMNQTCEKCDKGFYQDEEAQTTCKICPHNTTTLQPGSKNITDCLAPCQSGEVSMTGYEPCKPCDKGSFQSKQGAVTCEICPNSTSTEFNGSTSEKDCIEICGPGYYNNVSGLVPCEACPVGTYQFDLGSTDCFYCPDNTTTLLPASTNTTDCIEFDACANISETYCLNGGECMKVTKGVPVCSCVLGFHGDRCEINTDDCPSASCQNNGTCLDQINDYSCECDENFTGKDCDVNVDLCTKNKCLNGGSCLDLEVGFRCFCLVEYTGEFCEDMVDHCSSSPCKFGECVTVDVTAGFHCSCYAGYAGKLCDVKISTSCYQTQCKNGGVCREHFEGNSVCDCLPGFKGDYCELFKLECSSEPCLNNGTCLDIDGAFYCKCPNGFIGQYCQQETPSNFDLIFDRSFGVGYVRYPTVLLPPLKAFTVAFWFLVHQTDFGVVFSLNAKSENSPDKFVERIKFEGKENSYVLTINGESVRSVSTLPVDNWNHIVIDWISKHGAWNIYVNGSLSASGFNIGTGTNLKSQQSLMLGIQEDFYGGTNNIWNSFSGEISQFNFFDHLLGSEEMKELSSKNVCSVGQGNILLWTQALNGIYGEVTIRNQSHCLDVDECHAYHTCNVNQVCRNQAPGYDCVCKEGFQGKNCEDIINECSDGVCKNGGTCVDGESLYDVSCSCTEGFTGEFCEEVIFDSCNASSCINGKCKREKNDCHRCYCFENYRGDNCEILYQPNCDLSPCFFGSTCVEDVDDRNGYKCICPKTDGMLYDINCVPRPCTSSPCLNHGTCIESYDGTFACRCPESFYGQSCEFLKETQGCTQDTCGNNGVCNDDNGTIVCECINGRSGKTCGTNPEGKYKGEFSPITERISIFSSLGVIFVFIILGASFIGCKIYKNKRKYYPERHILSGSLNNAASAVGMTVLNNPVFEMDDDDDVGTRQRTSSGNYDNMYAELGDMTDDVIEMKNKQAKPTNKECNLERAAIRKTSESSYTSIRSSNKSLKRTDADYLQPIFTKNEFDHKDDVSKDCKILLPTNSRTGKNIPASFSVNESGYVPPSLSYFTRSENTETRDGGPPNSEMDYINSCVDSTMDDPCLRLQKYIINPTSKKREGCKESGFINGAFSTVSPKIGSGTNDDQKAYMLMKNRDSPAALPSSNDEFPKYLAVVEPKPGELPATKSKHMHIEPCKRKLPPLPTPK